jgi:hypothetical protein
MASDPEGEHVQPSSGVGDFGAVLADLPNAELLSALDLVLVELERTAGHLQVVGIGEWSPSSTNPNWSDDRRVTGDE